MSILIKGMNMPKSYHRCQFKKIFGFPKCKYINMKRVGVDKTPKSTAARYEYEMITVCPLFETTTPHGRLIDADELMKAIAANDYVLSYYNTTDRGMFTVGIK